MPGKFILRFGFVHYWGHALARVTTRAYMVGAAIWPLANTPAHGALMPAAYCASEVFHGTPLHWGVGAAIGRWPIRLCMAHLCLRHTVRLTPLSAIRGVQLNIAIDRNFELLNIATFI